RERTDCWSPLIGIHNTKSTAIRAFIAAQAYQKQGLNPTIFTTLTRPQRTSSTSPQALSNHACANVCAVQGITQFSLNRSSIRLCAGTWAEHGLGTGLVFSAPAYPWRC